MSSLEILPIRHPLDAAIRLPGSKSLTNRALLLSCLAEGATHLSNVLISDDSCYLADSLRTLGFDARLEDGSSSATVSGLSGQIPSTKAELFIGNAGTAARFLTALLTLGHGEYVLDGDSRMRQRPIGDLVSALSQLGVEIEAPSGCPPVKITADGLSGGHVTLAGDISSQFLSALLMVAPLARGPIQIEISTSLASKPYIDMTLAVMRDFGVQVERDGYARFSIQPAHYHSIQDYPIEPDATAASYFFAAAALCGGMVRVPGLGNTSRQGDLAFLSVLDGMGCQITGTVDYVEVGGASLRGADVNLASLPDTAQTLAAIAPFASSPTRIRGIASARVKETDRIHATCTELSRLGVRVEEHPDGMTIYPCERIHPGIVQTYNDHRMAMAFSLIGLRAPGIQIENPGCVSKTFPRFFEVLESLR